MKWTDCVYLGFVALFILPGTWARGQGTIKLPEEIKLKPNRLAKIEAVCPTPVKWINVHEDLDMIPDSSGRYVTVLAVKAGRFKIAAFTSGKDGPSEPAYCTIIVECPLKPMPPDKPPTPTPPMNMEKAIVKLRFGSAGCTATIVAPRRTDGRWDVLTAAHCTGDIGSKGSVILQDGKTFPVSVVARNRTSDFSWLIADANEPPPGMALLAQELPPIGTKVWHKGYGVDRPGNKEDGLVTQMPGTSQQLRFELNVSSGDSGSGIFRTDNSELVGVVCCTTAVGRKVSMYGCSRKISRYSPMARFASISTRAQAPNPSRMPLYTIFLTAVCCPTPNDGCSS